MAESFWSRLLSGLSGPGIGDLLRKSTPSLPPSTPIEVDFNQAEIDDLRMSVQSEFSTYLGYEIELEDATVSDGDDVSFRILGTVYLSDADDQAYREIFWRHQRRIVEAKAQSLHPWGGPGFLGGFPFP